MLDFVLQKIPEGDWFCNECKPKDIMKTPRKARRQSSTRDRDDSSEDEEEEEMEDEDDAQTSSEDNEEEDEEEEEMRIPMTTIVMIPAGIKC